MTYRIRILVLTYVIKSFICIKVNINGLVRYGGCIQSCFVSECKNQPVSLVNGWVTPRILVTNPHQTNVTCSDTSNQLYLLLLPTATN